MTQKKKKLCTHNKKRTVAADFQSPECRSRASFQPPSPSDSFLRTFSIFFLRFVSARLKIDKPEPFRLRNVHGPQRLRHASVGKRDLTSESSGCVNFFFYFCFSSRTFFFFFTILFECRRHLERMTFSQWRHPDIIQKNETNNRF